jgi:RsiW-degrading membrane proteinase PrsW (M82 family)
MKYLIIYLIGFIITYIICKITRNQSKENTWKDVFITFLISLFSWVGVIIIIIIYLVWYINKNCKNPPKWL